MLFQSKQLTISITGIGSCHAHPQGLVRSLCQSCSARLQHIEALILLLTSAKPVEKDMYFSFSVWSKVKPPDMPQPILSRRRIWKPATCEGLAMLNHCQLLSLPYPQTPTRLQRAPTKVTSKE